MSDPILVIRNRLADLAAIYASIVPGASSQSHVLRLARGKAECFQAQVDRGAYRIEATLSSPAMAALAVAESVKDMVDAHLRTQGYTMPSFDQAFAALRQACASSAFNPVLSADKLDSLPKPEPKEPEVMLKPEPKTAPAQEPSVENTAATKAPKPAKTKKAEAATNKDPIVYFEDVTPALASAYLKQNISTNRNVRKALVSRYAADMKAGRWSKASGSVMFDHLGNLIDGQHRLLAVIEAGITVRMKMESIPEGASLEGVDRGRSRTIGDLLELRGLANRGRGNAAAATARALYGLARGVMHIEPHLVEATVEHSRKDLEAVLGEWKMNTAPAPFIAPFVYAYPIAPKEVIALMKRVMENDGLKKNSGAWHLRNIWENRVGGGNDIQRYEMSVRVLRGIQLHLTKESQGKVQGPRSDGTEPVSVTWARKERAKAGANEGPCGEKTL